MSECNRAGCINHVHENKEPEQSPTVSAKLVPKKIPEHCVFKPGEIITFRGFNWKVGYTKDFAAVVLLPNGYTKKRLKAIKNKMK